MRATIELVCFDLDGTLVDSAPDISAALGHALETTGFGAPTLEQTRGWIGNGIEALLGRALEHAGNTDREIFHRALDAFHESYSKNLFRHSRLYPDVEHVLQTLGRDGYRLACITNKRADYAAAMLRQAGVADAFEFLYGGDSFDEKKPHPRQLLEAAGRVRADPGRCVMVGDADTDSSAAAAADFVFIWASFGYGRTLRSRDPTKTHRVSSFAELLPMLEAMMP